MNTPIAKGEIGGQCNRTVCSSKDAMWYNHSTRKYYCGKCARLINDANRADAQRLFGHELCTLETVLLSPVRRFNSKKIVKPSVVEKEVRKAVCDSIAPYENEYYFHNNGGHFVERLLKQLNDRQHSGHKWSNVELRFGDWAVWLRGSIYLTLTGCSSKNDGLSIPCKIRQEIEDTIIQTLTENHEKERV